MRLATNIDVSKNRSEQLAMHFARRDGKASIGERRRKARVSGAQSLDGGVHFVVLMSLAELSPWRMQGLCS